MRDVVFVAPSTRDDLSSIGMGTLLLATILKENNFDVEIHRLEIIKAAEDFDGFIEKNAAEIVAKTPSIVSFYCRCDCFFADLMIARNIKEKNKDITIVFGGPQADSVSHCLLEEIPFVDYCCSGEGEETIVPLFRGILNSEDITGIDGLTYRNSENVSVTNKRPSLRQNLDDIPFIDYSFVSPEIMEYTEENDDAFPIEVGRGCPFNCAFCSTSLFWKRTFRIKSPDRIIAEIKRAKKICNLSKFKFTHDLFTAKKNFVMEFCEKLKESGLDILWVCSSRVDTLDEEMIEAMASVGLKSIFLGVETGSPRMQKITHKNLDIAQVIDVCGLLVKKDLRIFTSFIYGFPEETQEDLEQTLQLMNRLRKMGVSDIQLHLLAILPGTEYFEKYENELRFAGRSTSMVNNYGVAKHYDFICEHKDLFSYYYEYTNSHREKYAKLEKCYLAILKLYDFFSGLYKEKFRDKYITDFYTEVAEANEDYFRDESNDKVLNFRETAENYIKHVGCSDADFQKISEILRFSEDKRAVVSKSDGFSEIKDYMVDIKAYREGKELSEIAASPTMVVFRKKADKITISVTRI